MGELSTRTLDADVLVIGGGLAGCMAAIRASELGVSVVLAEKGNTRRSGCAATGVDHCWTYIPEIHGPQLSLEDLVRDHTEFAGGFLDQELALLIASNSYQRVQDLERFGVPMRDENGSYRLVKKIHRVPTFLHFAGRDLKVKLTQEAGRRPLTIVNRMMVTELLTDDGAVCGAIGINTRSAEVTVFRARAVVLATGNVYRLYRNPTGMFFNTGYAGSETGDGHAMAYRAGAELINMEFTTYHTGPKNFQRCGRGSYTPGGRVLDGRGQPLGAVGSTAPAGARFAIDRSVESPQGFLRILEQGRGPIYMDCTEASQNDLDYIKWALENEGNQPLLTHLSEEGLDLGRDRIEFGVYEAKVGGGHSGVAIDARCESTGVKGLFAAGDCIGGVMRSVSPGAFTLGHHAGEMAARQAAETGEIGLSIEGEAKIDEKKRLYERILSRPAGPRWPEALLALQNTMQYYAGQIRSESMLDAGYKHLEKLRRRVHNELRAENAHELMRCLEVMNLLDNAEMVILAARERKESRFGLSHHRADYPQTDNDNWFKFLAVKRQGEKTSIIGRPIRHLF
ncbi:MAG: FAD-dependent oxidoreductase [Chloroflexi bacterium]|nr:FAD-dependent oxidoreductase [Chloroflexota bacterium]